MKFENEEVQLLFDVYQEDLKKAIDHLKTQLLTIRAGRANPHILDKITVDYYGTLTPLNQMANISVPEARMLTISLWDASMIKEVNKAILASDIGITPTDDGKIIRLIFPQLTEERRKELVKQVKKIGEDSKVVLRNSRRDANEAIKKLKKDNNISEDEQAECEKEIQKILDSSVQLVDDLLKDKEKEILEV